MGNSRFVYLVVAAVIASFLGGIYIGYSMCERNYENADPAGPLLSFIFSLVSLL